MQKPLPSNYNYSSMQAVFVHALSLGNFIGVFVHQFNLYTCTFTYIFIHMYMMVIYCALQNFKIYNY